VHFAVDHGFTNDPCGVVHDGRLYHLFFQYNPLSTQWSPACHWGHATSPDLVSWREVEVAISPEPGEIGCWTGSVTVDGLGPVIVYTRIVDQNWDAGQVALARPTDGMSGWRRVPPSSVISGPPAGTAMSVLRDPFVWHDGASWKAVLGGQLDGIGGCAVQFSSPDLESWSSGDVLAQRAAGDVGSPVGQVWECPQFFELDGVWVLLVSLDVAGQGPGWVTYALGVFDGARFEPHTWGRLTHGEVLYASAAFTDANSQRCIMSWFRESDSPESVGSAWASAMSLPHRLTVSGGRLVVSQHPGLDARLSVRRAVRTEGRVVDLGRVAATWRFSARLELERDSRLEFEVGDGDQPVWSLSFDSETALARLTQHDGSLALEMPLSLEPGAVDCRVDLVVDSDMAELVCADVEGIGAARIPSLLAAQLTVSASTGAALRDVVVAEPPTAPHG
jgi:beta-fructofuranosidase